MSLEIESNIKRLKVIEEKSLSFFDIDTNKNENKIQSLVGKYIIFEIHDKEKMTIETVPAKLLRYQEGMLYIRKYDDGTKETKELWTDSEGNDLFESFEEEININNVRGIEEYTKKHTKTVFKEEYVGSICEITNQHDVTIEVIITGFDGCMLEFDTKIENADETYTVPNIYPLYFIKDIKVLKIESRLKNETSFVDKIEGYSTKIEDIKTSKKDILVEGSLSKLKISETKNFITISGFITDETSTIEVMLVRKNDLNIQEFINKLTLLKNVKVLGFISEYNILVVKKIMEVI